MERRTERVSDQLARIRQDWERKRADPSVPGAPAPEGDGDQPLREEQRPEDEHPAVVRPEDEHPAVDEQPREDERPPESG